ncbi:LysR family transcriptional regulator (plasmid) [Roseomonas gilardii subsp. gilardii]|uniref:LysR family transcriptional regulator n=1 Tax=Roseomonas gilardii TaxID=257708 RepID=UPI001FF8767E|nr:LysR family transcriptional regulator [Roseomonas gilardii]UPG74663.1 LysR family transcriptional regulator [Roseomonas gilardii subsp. gilardii]
MDLRHLRYFVAVAEELNFTRAAARLGLNQAPLSQQIQQLEREAGMPLFDRLPRGVALTAAGRSLLRDARDILSRSEEALLAARRAARGQTGRLRIGFTSSAAFNPLVTRAIRDYREAFPEVRVELAEENTTQILKSLRAQHLDVAFIRPAAGEAAPLASLPVQQEEMLLAMPAGHPLARFEAVALTALREEAFILYPRRNGRALYDAILSACEAAGFTPQIEQEAPQMASTVTLIASGIGLSIVPASMGQLLAHGVAYRTLLPPAPRAPLHLVYQEESAREVTGAFTALVRSMA